MLDALKDMMNNPAMMQGTMTPRDMFAAAISIGMHANPELMEHVTAGSIKDGTHSEKMAETAYKFADALMEEKRKRDAESVGKMTEALSSVFKAATDSRD